MLLVECRDNIQLREASMPRKTLNPEVILSLTDEHFDRGIAGSECYCTIGQSVHDELGNIIVKLDLKSVDPTSIRVNPATSEGEPCVGVGFIAVDKKDREVNVQFLLEQRVAFKAAFMTDHHESDVMRRAARRKPYTLRASKFRVHLREATRKPGKPGNDNFTPEAHIKRRASQAVRDVSSADEAKESMLSYLESTENLPYEVTDELKEFAVKAAESAFAGKGTRPNRKPPVHIFKNQRFFS
jgi:hypothetical protein